MKKIILFAVLWPILITCQSQKSGDDFAFVDSYVKLQPVNPFTKVIDTSSSSSVFAMRSNIFFILSKETIDNTPGYFIQFWNFKNNSQQVSAKHIGMLTANQQIVDSSNNGEIFFITEETLKEKATDNFNKPKGILQIEGIVLPIKMRFRTKEPGGDFDFLQSLSLGPAISFLRNHGGAFGKSSTNFLVGFNITNVSVDENTAPTAVDSKTTLLGLSPFIGFTYEFSGVSISLLTGLDVLTGKAGKVWAYRNSPWLGISIGTSLFSPKSKQPDQTQSD